MSMRPTQREIDEAYAEIISKVAINDARKAAGAQSKFAAERVGNEDDLCSLSRACAQGAVMPVYFLAEGSRGTAVWRVSDNATDQYLCGVDLQAYGDEKVRERFAELATAAADYYRRTHVAASVDPAAWVSELPCSDCSSPEAADVLHRARQAASAS